MTDTRYARLTFWIITGLLGTVLLWETQAAKNKQKSGVFGAINGRPFNATNLNDPADPCVNGIYNPGTGSVTFVALECRAKRRRQGTAVKIKKHMYKTLAMSCSNSGGAIDTSTLPYAIPCVASIYGEWRTGRFGIPVGATQWGTTYAFGPPVSSSVTMRIDAFDGTRVRGVITGTFDDLDVPAAVGQNTPPTSPASISGELRFDFPFRVR